MKHLVSLVVLFAFCAGAIAQQPGASQARPQPAPAVPAQPAASAPAASSASVAKAEDVDTIDHIIAALYDVISGPAAQERDWNRFRSLFIPEARLVPNGLRPTGEAFHRVLSPDEYAERAKQGFSQQGFFENEALRKLERFANVAHAWSAYESRHEKGGQPFARGVNSIQLLNDGTRWYVVTIMWQGEDPKHPLPPEYVKPAQP